VTVQKRDAGLLVKHPHYTHLPSKRRRDGASWCNGLISTIDFRIVRHPAKFTNANPHFAAIRLRDLRRHGSDCLHDFHDRIVVRLPRREVHLFTREQAIAFWPVNFQIARLNLIDLGAADVGSNT
jgi:hypothetical protein